MDSSLMVIIIISIIIGGLTIYFETSCKKQNWSAILILFMLQIMSILGRLQYTDETFATTINIGVISYGIGANLFAIIALIISIVHYNTNNKESNNNEKEHSKGEKSNEEKNNK